MGEAIFEHPAEYINSKMSPSIVFNGILIVFVVYLVAIFLHGFHSRFCAP